MNPRVFVHAAIVVALGAGCRQNAVIPPGDMPLTRITADDFRTYGGLRDEARLVIRDEAALAALWAQIYATRGKLPPLPDVDFEGEMVIAAAMGEQSSGGFTIDVTKAAAQGDRLVVTVRSTRPGSSCAVTTALTQPYDVVKLGAWEGAVRFEENAVTVDCGR